MKIFNWNYKGYREKYYGTQEDWNQTIVTLINSITNMEESKLIVPLKFKSIFDSLLYFDKETSILNKKYKIEFVDTKHSTIYINLNSKLEILNF